MMGRARLSMAIAIALGTFGLAITTAAAHDVTVKNCTSRDANFYAFNQDDSVYLKAASEKLIYQRDEGSLNCQADSYCKVFAFDTANPHHRVRESITFYSPTNVNDFIDSDCSQKP